MKTYFNNLKALFMTLDAITQFSFKHYRETIILLNYSKFQNHNDVVYTFSNIIQIQPKSVRKKKKS